MAFRGGVGNFPHFDYCGTSIYFYDVDDCLFLNHEYISGIPVSENYTFFTGKRTGYSVSFRTKGITGLSNYSIQFENALSTGEIKGFGLSSDDALAQLKKGKDKLDLGLITQEEYDKLKADLTKYIK